MAIELDGVGGLPKENIVIDFGIRTVDLKIADLKGVNYRFRVGKTHHPYNSEKSKIVVKDNKLTICLFKQKQTDNWFALHKQNMIGETLDDK